MARINRRFGWFASIALMFIVHAFSVPAQGERALELIPRIRPAKPAWTVLASGQDSTRLHLKFAEDTGIRLRNGRFAFPHGAALSSVQIVLQGAGIGPSRIRPLFSRAEADLDAERTFAEQRSGRKLADLNLYYEIILPPSVSVESLCDALNALPSVELARPAVLPESAPSDLAPTTPDFQSEQDYRLAAPLGIGVSRVSEVPGANGDGIAIVDIEYQWILDHEDLELSASANIDGEAISDPFPQDEGNHGTAVLGVLGSRPNVYGVTGLVPAAELLVAPAMTGRYGYNPARAVSLATQALDAGDVILIEQQTYVCGTAYGPLEWDPSTFDAIAAATAKGIVVVEAAGNGAVDLDSPQCAGWFDRSARDSGAIIVGAGDPSSHERLSFSSYGNRVDLQGWGSSVATAGYGWSFDPGDLRQRYTGGFSGTSSASPIVAAAVASVQGALIANGSAPLTPAAMRDLLVSTGTVPPDSGTHIGPLPDVAVALEQLPEPQAVLGLGSGCAVLALLSRLRMRHRTVCGRMAEPYGLSCD